MKEQHVRVLHLGLTVPFQLQKLIFIIFGTLRKRQNSRLDACGHGEERGQTHTVAFIVYARKSTHTVSFVLCDCVLTSSDLYKRM
jgi:hypothetical protein